MSSVNDLMFATTLLQLLERAGLRARRLHPAHFAHAPGATWQRFFRRGLGSNMFSGCRVERNCHERLVTLSEARAASWWDPAWATLVAPLPGAAEPRVRCVVVDYMSSEFDTIVGDINSRMRAALVAGREEEAKAERLLLGQLAQATSTLWREECAPYLRSRCTVSLVPQSAAASDSEGGSNKSNQETTGTGASIHEMPPLLQVDPPSTFLQSLHNLEWLPVAQRLPTSPPCAFSSVIDGKAVLASALVVFLFICDCVDCI